MPIFICSLKKIINNIHHNCTFIPILICSLNTFEIKKYQLHIYTNLMHAYFYMQFKQILNKKYHNCAFLSGIKYCQDFFKYQCHRPLNNNKAKWQFSRYLCRSKWRQTAKNTSAGPLSSVCFLTAWCITAHKQHIQSSQRTHCFNYHNLLWRCLIDGRVFQCKLYVLRLWLYAPENNSEWLAVPLSNACLFSVHRILFQLAKKLATFISLARTRWHGLYDSKMFAHLCSVRKVDVFFRRTRSRWTVSALLAERGAIENMPEINISLFCVCVYVYFIWCPSCLLMRPVVLSTGRYVRSADVALQPLVWYFSHWCRRW